MIFLAFGDSHIIYVGSPTLLLSVKLDAWRPPWKGVVDWRCRQGPSHRWGGGLRLHPAEAARRWSALGVSRQRPISLETCVKCDLARHAFSIFLCLCSSLPPSLSTRCKRSGDQRAFFLLLFVEEPFCSEVRSFSPVRAVVT